MPHVTLDARMLHSGGIGTVLKALLPLATTLLHRPQDRAYLQKLGKHLVEIKSPIYSPWEQLELPLKIPHCDLFWSPHFNVPLLPIRAKKRLLTLQDTYHLTFFKALSFWQKRYAKLFYQTAIKRADIVTTGSEFSKQEILKHTRCSKPIHVISNPLPSHFKKVENTQLKSHYQLPNRYLLAVGNIKPHKNLLRLLQAYEKLKPPEPLLLVGKKEGLITPDLALTPYLNASPFLQKQVRFLGIVPDSDLPVLYSYATLFLFPSLYEGFGYPPLEAMACECPVIASNAASIPEICSQAVEYIDPYHIESMSNTIGSLLSDEKRRAELRVEGKKQIQKYHVQQTLHAYQTLIHENCNCP